MQDGSLQEEEFQQEVQRSARTSASWAIAGLGRVSKRKASADLHQVAGCE